MSKDKQKSKIPDEVTCCIEYFKNQLNNKKFNTKILSFQFQNVNKLFAFKKHINLNYNVFLMNKNEN